MSGESYAGTTGGWKLDTWSARQLPHGESALDIKLTNGVLAVTRHFIVFPGTAVVREWTTYENAGSQDVKVSDASFLDSVLMSEDLQDGNDLQPHHGWQGIRRGSASGDGASGPAIMLTPSPVRRRATICPS